MKTEIPLLENVRIASPCPKRWDDMVGGERVRFCRECSKNVYNLSEMRQEEAENLLKTHEGGRVCLTFYRRADGKILTADCPVGLRAARRVFLKSAARVSTALSAIFGGAVFFLFPVYGGGAEWRSPSTIRKSIQHDEQMIAEMKAQLNDKKHPISPDEREELESLIHDCRKQIKHDCEILQDRER